MKTTPLWFVVFALAAAVLLPHNVRAQSDDLLAAYESLKTLYDQGRYDEAEPHALRALAKLGCSGPNSFLLRASASSAWGSASSYRP